MLGFFASGMVFLGVACAIYCLYHYMKETDRKMSWWKWILAVLWFILIIFTAAMVGTFIGEGEPQAVLPGGGFFLVIIAISGAVLFKLLFPKRKLVTAAEEIIVEELVLAEADATTEEEDK